MILQTIPRPGMDMLVSLLVESDDQPAQQVVKRTEDKAFPSVVEQSAFVDPSLLCIVPSTEANAVAALQSMPFFEEDVKPDLSSFNPALSPVSAYFAQCGLFTTGPQPDPFEQYLPAFDLPNQPFPMYSQPIASTSTLPTELITQPSAAGPIKTKKKPAVFKRCLVHKITSDVVQEMVNLTKTREEKWVIEAVAEHLGMNPEHAKLKVSLSVQK